MAPKAPKHKFCGSHCLLVCNLLSAPNPRRGGGGLPPPPPPSYGVRPFQYIPGAQPPTVPRRLLGACAAAPVGGPVPDVLRGPSPGGTCLAHRPAPRGPRQCPWDAVRRREGAAPCPAQRAASMGHGHVVGPWEGGGPCHNPPHPLPPGALGKGGAVKALDALVKGLPGGHPPSEGLP